LGKALDQAKDARLELLEKMLAVIPKPRDTISPYAPRIFTLQIKTDKIGLIIGPGGRTIKSIIGDTDSEINIEPDGKVYIAASSEELGRDIKQKILGLVAEPEVGKIYHGVVVDVRDFGALVQILPNYVGLLHVSQISDKFVKDIRKEVRTGDKFDVKVMKVEDDGKMQLTRKFANNDSQEKNKED